MKCKIRISTVFAFLLIMFILAGCGAQVSTKLTIDEKFSGSREIKAVISAEDMSYVSGGVGALENVIKENIPNDMQYSVGSESGSTVMTFTIKFSSLEDYRKKVDSIIKSGQTDESSELVAEVIFEYGETYFKEGFKLSENFTSIDLMNWYTNALSESGIISESQGNWYETGSNTIVFAGKEYQSSSRLEADEQVKRCLSGIDVETTVKTDGSFERVIEFSSSAEVESELSAVGCSLNDYLNDLCPEGDSFENTSQEGSSQNTYEFRLKAESAEELLEKTDAVLQTKNDFSISIKAKEDTPGTAEISVTESLDGTYYLDYSSGRVTSKLKVYDNVDYFDSDTSYTESEGFISYRPNAGGKYTFNGEWKIGFGEVIFSTRAANTKKLEATLVFKPIEGLDEELLESAGSQIEKAAEKGGELKEDDSVYTVEFAGTVSEVSKEINRFIGAFENYDPENQESDGYLYFNADLENYNAISRFKKGVHGTITYDFTPLIGASEITFENSGGFFGGNRYTLSGGTIDGSSINAASSGNFDFYTDSISVTAAIIFAIAVLLLIAGAVMIVINKKDFLLIKGMFSNMKIRKAVEAEQTAESDIPESDQIGEFVEFAEADDTAKAEPALAGAGNKKISAEESVSQDVEDELL